jgi:hypothetical protein
MPLKPRDANLADLLAAPSLLALMVAGVAIVHAWILFTCPLWLDEYHTLFLAERGSLLGSMSDLRAGADFNPPLLYLVYRVVARVTGPLTPVSIRVVSFLIVSGALVLLYLGCRRIVPRSAALVGAFAVWCNLLTIQHAFDGRFYGPWLLCAALVAWSFGIDARASVSRKRTVAVAVSSILLCTIHYFGIMSLTLLSAGWAIVIAMRKESWRRLLPVLAGPVALALCAPFYVGQRNALTVKTWIAPVDATQIQDMLVTHFASTPLLIIVAMGLLGFAVLAMSRRNRISALQRSTVDFIPYLFLLLMPFAIIVFSILVQPSMIPRYAIVALLGWGAVAAAASFMLPTIFRLALLAILFYSSLEHIRIRADQVHARQDMVEDEAAKVRPFLDEGLAILIPSRHSLYLIAAVTGKKYQLLFPDFSDKTARERRFDRLTIIERDVARVHNARYSFPLLARIDDPHPTSDLYLFLPNGRPDTEVSLWFPGMSVLPLGNQVFRIRRTAAQR